MTSLDRRTFTRLSAMAAVAASLPARSQNEASQRPLRFAAVGLGAISDIFMRACANSQKAKITALVTGHPAEKGTKYSAMYSVPSSSVYTYETFDHIRDNPEIDAVYIGLPNSMHCEYTLRAAAAGKHVLCEKPMAISSDECRTMIAACRKAGVKLMIAYRIQYEPTWAQAAQLVRSGAIGQVQAFQGGFYGQPPKGAWRLSRKLGGGGSLLDLGIYPLNTIRYLLGEEPNAFSAVTSTRDQSGRFAEVEQTIQWTMKFPSGVLASCGSSYGAGGPGFCTINGDKGFLKMEPAFNYDGLHLAGVTTNGYIDVPMTSKAPYQFTLEADHFADCVHNNTEPKTGGEEGLKDMLAMEAIYKAAGAPIA